MLIIKGAVIIENNFGKGGRLFGGFGTPGASAYIANNISEANYLIQTYNTKYTIINNLFSAKEDVLALYSGGPHIVANNIFITTTNAFGNDHSIAGHKIISRNNIMTAIYFRGAAIWCNYDNDHRNNIVLNAKYGIRPSPDAPSVLRYNAFWKVGQIYENQYDHDSTNKYLFPMFVDEDAGDFRLQKYSPLIDAGDPDILDVDGTRSDIGPLGGPYGRSYEYLDLAPRAPVTVLPIITANSLTLRWQKNYETDLTGYRLYQDTVEQFVPFPDKLIYSGQDTNFTIPMPDSGRNYYYFVTAIDSIVNESKPSQPIKLLLTSTKENGNEVTTPEKTQIVGNYPNPFNPSTTIRYTINERSYVKLYIYTLRGELLEIRVNEEQSAGEYNYLFSPEITGTIDDLASGVYFYMLETKGRETGKIIRETGKMLLMK
ncbi:MAG: T9SS type A sorting domain-containing protein [Ignavibacteriaceae bacterium]|nr:T9SS type A sorting domain-containing protein [Ignavibacteriaceae bacterium]